MKNVIAAAAIVLGCTFATSAIGQDTSVKTKTKVDGDTQRKEEVKTESDLPQFHVTSIRNLAERCE